MGISVFENVDEGEVLYAGLYQDPSQRLQETKLRNKGRRYDVENWMVGT